MRGRAARRFDLQREGAGAAALHGRARSEGPVRAQVGDGRRPHPKWSRGNELSGTPTAAPAARCGRLSSRAPGRSPRPRVHAAASAPGLAQPRPGRASSAKKTLRKSGLVSQARRVAQNRRPRRRCANPADVLPQRLLNGGLGVRDAAVGVGEPVVTRAAQVPASVVVWASRAELHEDTTCRRDADMTPSRRPRGFTAVALTSSVQLNRIRNNGGRRRPDRTTSNNGQNGGQKRPPRPSQMRRPADPHVAGRTAASARPPQFARQPSTWPRHSDDHRDRVPRSAAPRGERNLTVRSRHAGD